MEQVIDDERDLSPLMKMIGIMLVILVIKGILILKEWKETPESKFPNTTLGTRGSLTSSPSSFTFAEHAKQYGYICTPTVSDKTKQEAYFCKQQ